MLERSYKKYTKSIGIIAYKGHTYLYSAVTAIIQEAVDNAIGTKTNMELNTFSAKAQTTAQLK